MLKHTKNGTPYLTASKARMIASTTFHYHAVMELLEEFGDMFTTGSTRLLQAANLNSEALCKFCGQLCYLAFGPGTTGESDDDYDRYFDNIKSSAHGSVLEHANYSFLCWGVDRSLTHEAVRHRAGCAYSQVSQRYVDGQVLRFVEREEFQADPTLHAAFEDRIDKARQEYDTLAQRLLEERKDELAAMSKRDARKAVNQAARACLPNETEAPFVWTANVRAWRHILNMRASKFADRPIRSLATQIGIILKADAPPLFSDFDLSADGRYFETKYPKV